jgi:tetratricopeptide (TPR) repeat protein
MKKKQRRQRTNPALVIVLLLLIGAVFYFDRFVVTTLPQVNLQPTATATPNAEQILTQARENFEQGNLVRAIELYQQAVQYNARDSNIFVELARAQILAGQSEAAETSAQNALLLNPDNPRAHAYLGWALLTMGDSLAAQASLDQALALDPELPEAFAFLAELAANNEDYEGAADLSRKAIDLAPNLLEARRARALVLEVTGNYEEAALAYEAALAINDRIADLHMGLGRTLWALEDLDGAVDQFNLADALNPLDPLPDAFISRIYLNTGDFAKAIQFAGKAVEDDPTNPRRYGNLGVAYYRNGDYPAAIEAFGLAIHGGVTDKNQIVNGLPLDYDIAEYFYLYAIALARNSQCGDALPVSQGLIAGVPADEIAVANANEVIRICEEALSVTPTALPTLEDSGTPIVDGTSALNSEGTPVPAAP